MRFEPYDYDELTKKISENRKWSRDNTVTKMLIEFVESNEKCARVVDWNHAYAASCSSSINTTIRIARVDHVKAVTCMGEVFLVRTDK